MSKEHTSDILFALQILGCTVLTVSQFFRMIETVEGVNFAMFLVMEMYLAINWSLAVMAHRAKPSRNSRQVIATYTTWFVLIGTNIGAIVYNSSYEWSMNDIVTFALSSGGVALTLFIAYSCYGLGFTDPIVKGYLAVFLKAAPQVLLAIKILTDGHAGTPGIAIIAGHITIIIRLGQLYFLRQEALADRNRKGLMIAEISNELSWIIVTVAWMIMELS